MLRLSRGLDSLDQGTFCKLETEATLSRTTKCDLTSEELIIIVMKTQ